jgi:hypothetical protein
MMSAVVFIRKHKPGPDARALAPPVCARMRGVGKRLFALPANRNILRFGEWRGDPLPFSGKTKRTIALRCAGTGGTPPPYFLQTNALPVRRVWNFRRTKQTIPIARGTLALGMAGTGAAVTEETEGTVCDFASSINMLRMATHRRAELVVLAVGKICRGERCLR